ncbi:GNAT family N-acetyltransferase [Bacillaceae bacterium W0354]
MSNKIIYGEKLNLRPIQKEDLKTLWILVYGEEDPEFKKWDAPYFPLEKIEYDVFHNHMSKRIDENFDERFLIVVNDEIIGTVNYYWEHRPSNWMEIGIGIYNPKYWSGGYGTEAIKLWINYLFESYKEIPRIGYTTWSGNIRMIRVGEKLGMIEEARIRKFRLYNGVYYDSVKMGILREEWEQKH